MTGLAENARCRRIEESPTLAITAQAARLKAAGKDVISLGAGEPDFPTPEPIAAAGVRAIETGNYRYTAAAGVAPLRKAGAEWLNGNFGLDYQPDEVMVCAGAKAALHVTLNAIIEPADRVLILAPYWVSYPALVTVAGGEPVVLPAMPESGFIHDAATIVAAAREHDAKGLLLNFPNNPSGAVANREQITAIVDAAAKADLWIVSDEIYSTLLYDGATHTSPAVVEGGRERTMVVNGFTKSHTLTGWRTSFLAGPQPIIDACARIQSQVLGNPSTISQAAMLAACEDPLSDDMARRRDAFDERRRYLVDEINRIPGLRLTAPQGAFYALVDAREHCREHGMDDMAMCEELLARHLLACVPGSAFAIPNFIRMSYAASMDSLREAVARLRAYSQAE